MITSSITTKNYADDVDTIEVPILIPETKAEDHILTGFILSKLPELLLQDGKVIDDRYVIEYHPFTEKNHTFLQRDDATNLHGGKFFLPVHITDKASPVEDEWLKEICTDTPYKKYRMFFQFWVALDKTGTPYLCWEHNGVQPISRKSGDTRLGLTVWTNTQWKDGIPDYDDNKAAEIQPRTTCPECPNA